MVTLFRPLMADLISFAGAALMKLLELIFEAAKDSRADATRLHATAGHRLDGRQIRRSGALDAMPPCCRAHQPSQGGGTRAGMGLVSGRCARYSAKNGRPGAKHRPGTNGAQSRS